MIIGLSGKFGVGKDCAAAFIEEVYPEFVPVSFATKVKQVVAILTDTTLEWNQSREGKASLAVAFGLTYGRLQQLVGEGMRQVICDDVWIRAALTDDSRPIIITDVRYPNEVKAIEERGGIVIRIVRDSVKIDDGRDVNHPSETALDDWIFKHYVTNNGTLKEFREQILREVEPRLL